MIKICKFFSAISNGKGKVLFFTLEDIQKIEKEGNPNKYESWNSHTSIAHYNGIKSSEEDKWNKWEYDCEKKELKVDKKLVADDDSAKIKPVIEKYLADNNAIYCQKIYNSNSGDLNSGNGNSGNWNSGNGNLGNLNTITPPLLIFNKETKVKKENISFPNYFCFVLCEWVDYSNMDDKEKADFPYCKITGGYLKKKDYKEAWKESFEKASKEDVEKTLVLPNFNYKIFEEISGITKKMIKEKLK